MAVWRWVIAGAAATTAAGAFWWWHDLSPHLLPGTTGTIFVSGPQVYTRERLVNDRYREDAWLLSELTASADKPFGITASVQKVSRSGLSLTGTLGSPAAAGAGESSSSAIPAAKADADADHHAIALDATPFDRLHALLAYREQVRTLMIENQLDDRHDLRGNSLYRLRFDATVLPGWNTSVSANVVVSVLPPEGLINDQIKEGSDNTLLRDEEDRLTRLNNLSDLPKNGVKTEVWTRIYLRWLDSVSKRFEDARSEMHAAYDSNLFTPSDYDRLLSDIEEDVSTYSGALVGQVVGPALSDDLQERLEKLRQESERGALTVKSIGQKDVDCVTGFRKNVATLTREGLVSHEAHGIFKREIERLIRLIKDEAGLQAEVSRYRSLKHAPQATEVRRDLFNEYADWKWADLVMTLAASPPVDDGCGGSSGYDVGAGATLGLNQSDNVGTLGFSSRFYLDRAFQGRVSKSVLGLEPPPPSAIPQSISSLNLIEDLQPLAVVESDFGAAEPAFRFRAQTLSFKVTNLESCIPASRRRFEGSIYYERRPSLGLSGRAQGHRGACAEIFGFPRHRSRSARVVQARRRRSSGR